MCLYPFYGIDKIIAVVFNKGMKRALLSVALCLVLPACTQVTRITDIADLPVKSTGVPRADWENSPLRAHAMYVLYDAKSPRDRKNFVGDYYYVNWYDAEPQKPVKIVMRYTQARTTRQVLTREIELAEPRSSSGSRKDRFVFNGPERAQGGDVLSWRIELYVDGELRDSRQSYLWK